MPVEILEIPTNRTEMQISDCIHKLIEQANQGDAEAQYELGNAFYFGKGVEKSEEEAIKWYEMAATKGHINAIKALCNVYWFSRIEHRKKSLLYWTKKAAHLGITEQQVDLGDFYFEGLFDSKDGAEICILEKNLKKAVMWYHSAALKGDGRAYNKLGDCYYNGTGVEQNYEEAAIYYQRACEWYNFGESKYKLAKCYANGHGVKKNEETAFQWYKKAAQSGRTEAKYQLAECYYYGFGTEQNYVAAIEIYQKIAEDCWYHTLRWDAKYRIAECYYNGFGIKQNQDEAIKIYQEIANNTNVDNLRKSDALCRLGDYYYKIGSETISENFWDREGPLIEAKEYYQKAVKQNHAEAQFKLGECYLYGKGEAISPKYAVELYEKSAQQGYIPAQHKLGCAYKYGLQVTYPKSDFRYNINEKRKFVKAGTPHTYIEKDILHAAKWFQMAMNQGDEKSSQEFCSLFTIFTTSKLNKAGFFKLQ